MTEIEHRRGDHDVTGVGFAVSVRQFVLDLGKVSAKPADVIAWTDFRTNHINGDIYGAMSH